MKIYNSPVAPNPRRVRIFLAEKDIKVPFEDIDIANAVNRQPEFRKKTRSPAFPCSNWMTAPVSPRVSRSAAISRSKNPSRRSLASARKSALSSICGIGAWN